MKQLSIKLRVTLFYTAILAVILSLMLGFVFLALDLRIVYSTRADLESAVENAFDDIDFKGGQLEIDSGIDLYHDGITLVLYGPCRHAPAGRYASRIPGGNALNCRYPSRRGRRRRKWQVFDMYVGYGETGVWVRGIYSLSANDSALNYVTVASTVSFPLVLLLSAAGGYLITKRAFRPVERITQAANRISGSGDLSARLPDEGSDEIARLAQAFNAMLDRLEAAFEREKQFTSDASHELRTPISVILSQADFALANPGDPQETLRALQAIQSQGKKMSALVAQLLELTRADNQTLRLEKEPIDLATLCETVAEELAERADKRGISIECLLQPEVMLEGDQTLLTRMMMNLVSNAISYGKEYGHIWIRLIQKDTGIRLSIEDDGIGIAPEHINRIFDRFYRVDSSRSGAQGGSAGLGLAMVRWIVQAHDGTIQVESEPGKGSAFLVIFPT